MSKEYIEREEVREAFYMEFDEDYADDIVDRLSTADVEEVKHGKWYDGRCTCCGWEFPDRCSYYGYDDESFERTPYCPNCGAKMDKR